jgi:hypothetical protein
MTVCAWPQPALLCHCRYMIGTNAWPLFPLSYWIRRELCTYDFLLRLVQSKVAAGSTCQLYPYCIAVLESMHVPTFFVLSSSSKHLHACVLAVDIPRVVLYYCAVVDDSRKKWSMARRRPFSGMSHNYRAIQGTKGTITASLCPDRSVAHAPHELFFFCSKWGGKLWYGNDFRYRHHAALLKSHLHWRLWII